jgi:uncharacterized membrane protein YhdT
LIKAGLGGANKKGTYAFGMVLFYLGPRLIKAGLGGANKKGTYAFGMVLFYLGPRLIKAGLGSANKKGTYTFGMVLFYLRCATVQNKIVETRWTIGIIGLVTQLT